MRTELFGILASLLIALSLVGGLSCGGFRSYGIAVWEWRLQNGLVAAVLALTALKQIFLGINKMEKSHARPTFTGHPVGDGVR